MFTSTLQNSRARYASDLHRQTPRTRTVRLGLTVTPHNTHTRKDCGGSNSRLNGHTTVHTARATLCCPRWLPHSFTHVPCPCFISHTCPLSLLHKSHVSPLLATYLPSESNSGSHFELANAGRSGSPTGWWRTMVLFSEPIGVHLPHQQPSSSAVPVRARPALAHEQALSRAGEQLEILTSSTQLEALKRPRSAWS